MCGHYHIDELGHEHIENQKGEINVFNKKGELIKTYPAMKKSSYGSTGIMKKHNLPFKDIFDF